MRHTFAISFFAEASGWRKFNTRSRPPAFGVHSSTLQPDIRYHDFAECASSPMAIFDIGHFESESCAKQIFYKVIKNKFANFAVDYSDIEQNPVKYL